MTQKELDVLAYRGEELPRGVDYADALYFALMRGVYDHAKQMPGEGGNALGRREKAEVQAAVKRYRLDCDLAAYQAGVTRATESARIGYRKARKKGDTDGAISWADKLVERMDRLRVECPPDWRAEAGKGKDGHGKRGEKDQPTAEAGDDGGR